MEFFEDAISKAKGAFDVAYKKTSEVISVQRQKIDVATMKTKLSKEYELLGKLVIDAVENGTDIPEGAKIKVKEIRAREVEIEAANDEILKTQGKKFCPNCGASNVHEAHFCYACGESFIGSFNNEGE